MRNIRFFVLFVFLFIQCAYGEPLQPTMTVSVPMRDGTELTTDLYMASPDCKHLPCILLRSPAGRKSETAQMYTPLIAKGYLVAVQDTRSAMDPEGKTFPYLADGWGRNQDGFDTVEWLAKSPYCNGKVGTAGWSAMGITQLMMAPTAPPALKCQFIGVAAPSVFHYATQQGGCIRKNQVEGWLGLCAKDPSVLETVCKQPMYNAFWTQFDSIPVVSKVQAPAIHYGGWFDIFSQGTIDAFVARQNNGGEGARGKQKLLMGPWTHFWPAHKHFGDFDVPHAGIQPPIDISANRLFDFYLKGEKNGFEEIPPVVYYVMGPFDGSPSSGNVWRTSEVWPIPAKETPFYLTKDKKIAEASKSDHEGNLSYRYSHDNPVPTIGGGNLFMESGPKDQRQIEARPDVLAFTSEPLAEDLEVTGRIAAELYLTSAVPMGDVVVRLTDVYPDGRSILILDGIARAGVPHSPSLDPKKPAEIHVDLWTTSIVFAKGHRIGISITGSNFPKFQKCPVSTENGEVAYTLYFGPQHPSHVTLPIVRRGDKWLVAEQPTVKK